MRDRRRLAVPAILLMLATSAGCSSDGLIGAFGSPGPVAASELSATSQLIGEGGGVLRIPGAAVTIPAVAVRDKVVLTMSLQDDGTIELGPHGQTFTVPVALAFDLPEGVSADRTVIQWYDPAAARWTDIPSTSTKRTRTALLSHFSRYQLTALASDSE